MFMIQAIYGSQFADLYVTAETVEQAIEAAKAVCPFPVRWTRFVA